MFFSRLFTLCYLLMRCTLNLVRLPVYFLFDTRRSIDIHARSFVDGLLNLHCVHDTHIRTLNLVGLQNHLKGPDPSLCLRFDSGFGNVNCMEALVLAYITQCIRPTKVFEIGTFDGFSTYHLAMNSSSRTAVFTLNLDEHLSFDTYRNIYSLLSLEYFSDSITHDLGKQSGIGRIYRQCPSADKVTQLFGDSLTYDFSRFENSIDLCFIDGGHSDQHIRMDSANALKMVRPGGFVVWHDYNVQHRDIYRFLRRFSKQHSLFHVSGTRLVFFQVPIHSQGQSFSKAYATLRS